MTRAKIKKQLALCQRKGELLLNKMDICDKIIADESKRKNSLKKEAAKNTLYFNTLIKKYYTNQ